MYFFVIKSHRFKGALGHETITAPATEAVQATSVVPTAEELAGIVIAVGGMRVARRHSAGASAKAVAMHAAAIAINSCGRIGRQVARVATMDPEVELKLIDASSTLSTWPTR